ncbi:Alpha/Beta hydrolase protein [Mycena rosella]|uniref:Alpha/Beta hydrolase protein n=1 Tax=Mycena rosella TaxID=1033263 RepID=A0AAD7G7H3_MYCRO|nr:Alpha/Beta hydrolase protein [Mycena rosella]
MVPRSFLSFAAAAILPYALATQNWSSPAHYPGKPSGAYSDKWQDCPLRGTEPLENVTWSLPRNWAGSISTHTVGSPNNTAFFWGFEKSNGSLTDTDSTEPWMIWLAGGPGYSSIASMLVENIGPIVFFVDAPVGTGYSTVGRGGYPADEDQVAVDFSCRCIPSLQKRPLHLNRTITFGKIGSSNPALSEANLFENIPILRVIETYPQLIDYNTDMYDYLREQTHICKFDLNLTYPQTEKLPYTRIRKGQLPHRLPQPTRRDLGDPEDFMRELHERWLALPEAECRRSPEERELRRREWVRETFGDDADAVVAASSSASSSKSSKSAKTTKSATTSKSAKISKTKTTAAPNSTVGIPGLPPFNTTLTGKMNPFFGCDLRDTAMLYALNYTYPWKQLAYKFDFLDIPYTVNPISENVHPHHWMNHNTTRAALHAPNNKIWRVTTTTYSWGNAKVGTDPSPPSTFFMDELAANATKENIGIVWYSGNDDALTTHWSTEVVIQNTTFGGIQGFTVKPNTSWFDDEGLFAGIVRQERGWTYGLIYGAGHQTPVINPARTFSFIRDFFIGNSSVGRVDPETGAVATQPAPAGADIPNILPDGVITGQAEVHYKTGMVTWPSATVAAWNDHVSSVFHVATAVPMTTESSTKTKTKTTKSSTASSATATATSSA